MEKTKDVEIGGRRYKIGRLTARNGSWILTQILTKMLPSGMDDKIGVNGVSSERPAMSESEFHSIQDHCLAVCSRYETEDIAMPIIKSAGVFAIPDMEYDITAVMALTVHSLMFNLSPFFVGGGLSQIMESLPGLSQSPSLP